MAIPDGHDGSPCIRIATLLRPGEWKGALELVKECYDQLILWVPPFLTRHRPREKKIGIPQQVGSQQMSIDVSVKSNPSSSFSSSPEQPVRPGRKDVLYHPCS